MCFTARDVLARMIWWSRTSDNVAGHFELCAADWQMMRPVTKLTVHCDLHGWQRCAPAKRTSLRGAGPPQEKKNPVVLSRGGPTQVFILPASTCQVADGRQKTIEQSEMAELLIKDRQNEAFTPAQEMRLNAYWIRSLFHTQYVFHETHRGEWLGKGWQTAFRSYGSLRRVWSSSGTGTVLAHQDLFSPDFIKFMEANVLKGD
jgi:hypothetical protein